LHTRVRADSRTAVSAAHGGGLHAIRDPIWGHIYLDDALYDATKTPPFIRLSDIKQLGPAHLVYPGATHTRASHSIGVYYVAHRLIHSLTNRGASSLVTQTGEKSFLAAALFHDIGHFPYTHSLKELPLKAHETLSAEIILSEPIKSLIGKAGGNPYMSAAIIDTREPSDNETQFFRSLLSGVLDPDKIDYLNRDAFFCGVPYGAQDADFILSKLIPDKEHGVCLDSDGILSVEHVLFSKYLMYRSVYWHRQVRAATAMMKKSVFAALTQGLLSEEALYSFDDKGIFLALTSQASGAQASCMLAQSIRDGQIFPIVYEIPFDSKNPFHTLLEDIAERTEVEAQLAEKLSLPFEHVVIDVPERISFESTLPILDAKPTQTAFSQSSTVFEKSTVALFSQKLRKIRCAIKLPQNHPRYDSRIEDFFSLYYNKV